MNEKRADQTARHAADKQSELALEDTAGRAGRGVRPRTKSGVSGYNPYDAVPSEKPKETKKAADLRKLSEWIRLRRQVAALKNSDPAEKQEKK